jgi:Trm5-related predicted tRNA methylase
LSPDAEETMSKYDPEKIYIIGGLVDRNHLKGATLEKS